MKKTLIIFVLVMVGLIARSQKLYDLSKQFDSVKMKKLLLTTVADGSVGDSILVKKPNAGIFKVPYTSFTTSDTTASPFRTKANSYSLSGLQAKLNTTLASGQTIGANTTGSSATLTNTRTIWGQNFNGSANVSGAMTGVSSIVISGSISGGTDVSASTITGSTNIQSNGFMSLNGLAGTSRDFGILSNGSNRWTFRVNSTAESGSNAGSDLEIIRRSDAAANLASAVRINRATGLTTLEALNLTNTTASTMLKSDASKNIVSATAGTDYATPASVALKANLSGGNTLTGTQKLTGDLQLTAISSGTAGTDSILVKKSADNKVYKIPADYYATSASVDAKADLASGTWTPSSSTVTLTVNFTYYQTVGKMTTAFFDINFPVSASGTAVAITGLPTSPYNYYPLNISVNDSGLNIYGETSTTGNTILLTDNTHTAITYMQMSGKRLAGSITYRTPLTPP